MIRTSVVKTVNIKGDILSSVVLIGDGFILKPRSNVFAVQRKWELFDDREGDLRNYPLFFRPLPRPVIWEPINVMIQNVGPFIKVGHVKILGVSTSGIFQIGSNFIIDSESRVKHFRQLLPADRPKTVS